MKDPAALQALLNGTPRADAWNPRRQQAQRQAQALAWPDDHQEAWRLTGVAALYERSETAPSDAPPMALEIPLLDGVSSLVFVDGVFSPEYSRLDPDATGVELAPLGRESTALHPYFDQALGGSWFARINTRNFTDCAWIHVTGRAQKPIHVLHVARTSEPLYARAVVVLEEGSEATLVEEFWGESGHCLNNAVTEVVVKAAAVLRHIRVERESEGTLHLGACAVTLHDQARYEASHLALGGRFSRYEQHLRHLGSGSEARLEGLIVARSNRVAATLARIDHLGPGCRTVQSHRCVATDRSTAVFTGKLVVHPGANGTDTRQTSRNLLLSPKARIDAQPELEIATDDVSCKHGATVGKLDEEALFYLMSRGLSEPEAKRMLIHAFAAEIIAHIGIPALTKSLERSLAFQIGQPLEHS